MSFDPEPGLQLNIEGTVYQISEHPAAPGIAFGQEGRAAIVYKLDAPSDSKALKVFKTRYRTPDLASLASRIALYASIPGLTVCRRTVLTPQLHSNLLRNIPELTYAVLMPWIEGPTWLQVLQEKTPFNLTQSHSLSQAFAHILAEMEQQGVAHCDLSAANLMLPFLDLKGKNTSYAPIELVDVEQIYAKNLERPEAVPSGSDGYSHKTIRQEKIWNAKTDRFAGTILLAEMLGWADPTIRKEAWGESFFDPQELQRSSRRYELLHNSIVQNWGANSAMLLERAWSSEILADCPTFGEWLVTLPEAAPKAEAKKASSVISSPGNSQPADTTIATLLSVAEQLTAQGNRSGALETYRKTLTLVPDGSATSQAIRALIFSIETSLSAKQLDVSQAGPAKASDLKNKLACPYCETPITDGTDFCPICGNKIVRSIENVTGSRIIRTIQKPFKNLKAWETILILTIIVGVILFAYQFMNRAGEEIPVQPTTAVAAAMVTNTSTETVTPSITFTVEPTSTQRPTSTKRPTSTLWPTVVPSPTVIPPAFLNTYLKGVKITRLGTFDSKESDMAFNDDNVKIQNGQMYFIGNGFTGGAEKNKFYGEGQGILMDFKLSKDQPSTSFDFGAFFDHGSWWTDGYRRFGISFLKLPVHHSFHGKNYSERNLLGNITIEVNTWYHLVMTVGEGGDFFCAIWSSNAPTRTGQFRQRMEKDWAGIQWRFAIDGAKGKIEMDNLMDISFDGYKK